MTAPGLQPSAPPPLYSSPGATPPAGAQAEWFEGAGGLRLRAAWFPCEQGRGSVILSPGRTETIEKYYEVVGELHERGFGVLVHDWRGQGLSDRLCADRLKGHAQGWQPFLDDYKRLLDRFAPRMPQPWIGLGHSMGGALTALALVKGERRFSGVMLCSPMCGVNLGGQSYLLARALAGLSRLAGFSERYAKGDGNPFTEVFEGNEVTHDPRRWARDHQIILDHRDLALGGATLGWLDFALTVGAMLGQARPLDTPIPVSIVGAGQEKLADNTATQAFATRMGATLSFAPSALHEILMETDDQRALFWSAFDQLAERTAPKKP